METAIKKRGYFATLLNRFIKGSVNEGNNQDHFHQWLLRINAFSVVLLLALMVYQLWVSSVPALKEYGLDFFITDNWDPIDEKYSSLAFVQGTLLTSLLALLFATPFSVGAALFLTQICPRRLRNILGFLIEVLAAIPSIIYGMWALFFVAPLVREHIAPAVYNNLGFIPFFKGPSFGIGIFTASIVLAIMISPIITSISSEVFKKMPDMYKEGALALGATRIESIWLAVFRPSIPGVLGAVILGLGRAFGETMAVAMVIGNNTDLVKSIFSPGSTMASVIANEYAEATDELHLGALSLIGLILFVVSLGINLISRSFVWRYSKKGAA